MAKRHINKQQKRRIENIQQKRREKAAQQSTQKQTSLNEQGLSAEQTGLVITNFGQSLIIEDQNKKLFRCVARQNLGSIVCGDQVIWQQALNDEGVIVAVERRSSLLQKPGFGGKLKAMAANINQIVIVSSIQPAPNAYLIDRYLVAAENLPATPIILLNKTDLLDKANAAAIQKIEKKYAQLDYRVIKASNILDHGFDELHDALKTQTSIFVGLSGVGKSSLINHLLPDADIRVGGLSESSGEGKHTTTSSNLYHLACGGNIIDSPGVRDFGLWSISADDILHGFKELRPFIGQCKFSNCAHENEPGCRIQKALADNMINPERFNNYKKILQEYSKDTLLNY